MKVLLIKPIILLALLTVHDILLCDPVLSCQVKGTQNQQQKRTLNQQQQQQKQSLTVC